MEIEEKEEKSEFQSEFTFDPSKKCYIHTNCITGKQTRLRGIVKLLAALFYPSYDFQTCISADKFNKFKRDMLGMDTVKTDTARVDTMKFEPAAKYASKTKGMDEGKLIDDHVTCIIQNKPIETEEQYPVDETTFKLIKSVGLKITRKSIRRTHPLAQKFMRTMIEWGYTPLAAQVVVGDVDLGIVTAADSIWYNTKTMEKAMVEMKKYHGSYYDLYNDQMRIPYKSINNSPHNQHQLQLGWTRKLYDQTLPNAPISECFVVQLDAGPPQRHDLEDWVLEEKAIQKTLPRLDKLMTKLNATRLKKWKKAMIRQKKAKAKKRAEKQAKEEKKRLKKEQKEIEKEAKREARRAEKEALKASKKREKQAQKGKKKRKLTLDSEDADSVSNSKRLKIDENEMRDEQ